MLCASFLIAMGEGPALPKKLEKKRCSLVNAINAARPALLRADGWCLSRRVHERVDRLAHKAAVLSDDLRASRVDYWHWPLLDGIDRVVSE